MRRYKEFAVWIEALEFADKILGLEFIPDEKFGIQSQIRRAGLSIGANITEGAAKSTNKSFKNYLNIALGSACECEFFLLVCEKRPALLTSSQQKISELLVRVQRLQGMLIRFENAIK